jgi:hypothetical protein
MKKAAIMALVCINVALLLGLLLGSGVPEAKAQGLLQWDYLMVSSLQPGRNVEAIYIIDLARSRLAAVRYDRAKKRMVVIGARDLRRDFSRGPGVRP